MIQDSDWLRAQKYFVRVRKVGILIRTNGYVNSLRYWGKTGIYVGWVGSHRVAIAEEERRVMIHICAASH